MSQESFSKDYIFFPRATLKEIHKYVFQSKYELCANLKNVNNELLLNNKVTGTFEEYEKDKFRGACNFMEYSSNVIHTHPHKSYAYPSIEDIMMLLQRYGKIKHSFIGTKWGIWVCENTTTSNVYSETTDKELFDKIFIQLNELGGKTKTSSTQRKNNPDIDNSRELTDDYIKIIAEKCREIEKICRINLNFYKWEQIKDGFLVNKELKDYKD